MSMVIAQAAAVAKYLRENPLVAKELHNHLEEGEMEELFGTSAGRIAEERRFHETCARKPGQSG